MPSYVLGGKAPQTGHKVSHSNKKSKRKWMPNAQKKSLYSETLQRFIRFKTTARALRSVDKVGGLDAYLLNTSLNSLDKSLLSLRKSIQLQQTQPEKPVATR